MTPLFFPANNGREPLYIYLLSLFVNVLGNNAFVLRLPAAMAGVVAVASTFALGRRLLDERAALIGAGFVAVTFWTVSLSRISYRANLFLALFPIFLLLLWRCRDRSDLRPYIVAGALLGLMQYTYVAARFVPLLAIVLLIDWRRAVQWRGVSALLTTAGLVALPLVVAIYLNPAAGFQRSQQVWLFSRPEPWSLFWFQLVEHLKMAGITGDPIWLHNIPGRPPIVWFVAPFFLLGFVLAWGRAAPRMLAWTIAVMIWPGILAVSGTPLPPNHLRVLVMAPAVFLLTGYGIMRLFAIGATDATQARRTSLALLAGILILIADGALSQRDYMHWQNTRESFEQYDADMSALSRAIESNPDTFFVIPLSWGWPRSNYWSIDFLTDFATNYAVVERPFVISVPDAGRVGLVRWLAGMHADADPQRRIDAQLRLAGYTPVGTEDGKTYQIDYFTPTAAKSNRAQLSGGPIIAEGGLRFENAVLYCFLPDGASSEQLAADLTWQSDAPYPVDLSASVRLVHLADGRTAAQVDSWLQNSNGRAARQWESPDSGTQVFEFSADPLPAGEYELWAIAYETESTQPIALAGESGYSLGRVTLPLCAGRP